MSVGGQGAPKASRGNVGRQPLIFLALVVAVFVGLCTFIAVSTPALESADEPSHVLNVETLVSGKWYGMKSSCHFDRRRQEFVDCSGAEAHQAPLYYVALAGWQQLVRVPAHAPFRVPATFEPTRGAFARHSQRDLLFLLWLRLPNVLLGALTVLAAYAAVRVVTSDPWTPVVAASIVAFMPRFVFLSAFVTNDNFVNLFGAVLTLAALRYTRAPSARRMMAVGLVMGLLVATKLSTLPLAIVLVLLPFMAEGWKRRAEYFAVGIVGFAATCGWYLIQNAVRYGDPLARSASSRYLEQVGGLGTLPGVPYQVGNQFHLVFVGVPRNIFRVFWYQSGWNQFYWSWPVNLLFWIVLATALVGLNHRHVARPTLVVAATISIAALLTVWIVAFQTSTYQARYALVGLAAISCLAALGLESRRLPIRFLLPAMGLCGTLVAIHQDVLNVHWA